MTSSLKETWLSPKAEVKDSPAAGKGMFAQPLITEGETVVIWGGEYTNVTGATEAKVEGKHVMQWDDDLYSVEVKGEDLGYFINHSCDPNIWMKDAFTLIARKTISPGEEITADYALLEADENHTPNWVCNCGSTLCRHQITGKDWRLKDLQERYKDHFSPLINKRIKDLL